MRRKRVTITLEPETLIAIEMQRGKVPRSNFIEGLILKRLRKREEKRRRKNAGYR